MPLGKQHPIHAPSKAIDPDSGRGNGDHPVVSTATSRSVPRAAWGDVAGYAVGVTAVRDVNTTMLER